MTYTLTKERYGFCCRYSGNVSPDDFLQCMLEVNMHSYFKQASYCIHDFLGIETMRRGLNDLSMILAHSNGASTTNSKIKIALVASTESALTFADWYKRTADENIEYFPDLQGARNWTCSSEHKNENDGIIIDALKN